jgi:hypothetical protein
MIIATPTRQIAAPIRSKGSGRKPSIALAKLARRCDASPPVLGAEGAGDRCLLWQFKAPLGLDCGSPLYRSP